MTNELSTLATLLGREHWRVESVTVRIHVLRMAISGDWPGSVDDADAGLADAVDRLRQEELARAVVANGCGARYGLEGEPTLSELVTHAADDVSRALLGAADGLAVAIDAARTAAAEATARLDEAAYDRPTGAVTPAVTPSRAAAIARLLQRVVPPSIDHFLAQRVG